MGFWSIILSQHFSSCWIMVILTHVYYWGTFTYKWGSADCVEWHICACIAKWFFNWALWLAYYDSKLLRPARLNTVTHYKFILRLCVISFCVLAIAVECVVLSQSYTCVRVRTWIQLWTAYRNIIAFWASSLVFKRERTLFYCNFIIWFLLCLSH